jgi:hypothetical protein
MGLVAGIISFILALLFVYTRLKGAGG